MDMNHRLAEALRTLRSIDMKKVTRNLVALIALAVAIGAPLTPARALVPTAWARSHDESGLVINIKTGKKERLPRDDSRAHCAGHSRDRASCARIPEADAPLPSMTRERQRREPAGVPAGVQPARH